jgi:hypothetical protein
MQESYVKDLESLLVRYKALGEVEWVAGLAKENRRLAAYEGQYRTLLQRYDGEVAGAAAAAQATAVRQAADAMREQMQVRAGHEGMLPPAAGWLDLVRLHPAGRCGRAPRQQPRGASGLFTGCVLRCSCLRARACGVAVGGVHRDLQRPHASCAAAYPCSVGSDERGACPGKGRARGGEATREGAV